MKKYLFLLAFFGFLLQGCVKTATTPIDHVNKFTCKVNGVFWEAIPYQNFILGNDLQMDKSPFFDFGSIHARNTKKQQSIGFNVPLNDSVRTANIILDIPFSDYSRNCVGYFLDTLSSRKVVVTTHDRVKKIIKGTFSFRAIDIVDSCKDTVTITDGFFDMQYSAQ
jgi:hypothetical protein